MCEGSVVRARFVLAAALGVLMLAGACSPSAPDPGPTGSDPTGTAVTPTAAQLAATLTDDELVSQVLMLDLDVTGDVADATATMQRYQPGGVILMGYGTSEQVRALTHSVQAATAPLGGQALPALVSVDQEFGFVRRVSDIVQVPAAMAFGAAARPDLTQAAWAGVGAELRSLGINIDNAPDADVIGPAGNTVIGSRSYGSDAANVADQVRAVVQGLRTAGMAATLKHFPGHGNTTVNSHDDLPVLAQSREELEAVDLVPFRAGIAAGAQLVMTGHLVISSIDPTQPATYSSKVLVDLLRNELGFTGVVITDALNMEAARVGTVGETAVRAILAGTDMLLMPPSAMQARDGLLAALHDGRLTRERLEQSVARIIALKQSLAHEPAQPSAVDTPEHRAAAAAVAAASVTVLAGHCGGALVSGPVRVTTSDGRAQAAAWLTEALAEAGVTVVDSGGTRVHLVGYGDDPDDLAPDAAVTVAMDTPYVLAESDSSVRIATYSSTQVSMRALADVLAGRAQPAGRSPVPVAGLPASACTP